MADLSKLKLAIGQMEVVAGRPSANEAACDRMVGRALDSGADVLVVPASLNDPRNVRLIGLNDSRIDIAGNVVVLDANGETYRIGIDEPLSDCDFTISSDVRPYTVLGRHERKCKATVVVNPVGMRDDGKHVCAFDGGSKVYGADGSVLTALGDGFEEDFALVSLEKPGNVPGACERKLLKAIVSTIRRFDEQVLGGKPKWVIGLSGGLDSSVVAALLVLALGPQRVIGYNLATRYNSIATKTNAATISSRLGIPLRNGSIEDLVVSVGNTLVQYGYAPDALKGLVLENVQARTRGNLLSTFAAVEGGVVVNNGNRVEAALGYATLYGDAIGALAPIGDMTKVQLFDIARDVNAVFGDEVVPENLIPVETEDSYRWDTMPSAELASGQKDPMKWFYHDWLIGELLGDGSDIAMSRDDIACGILERYLDDRLIGSPIGKWVRFYELDEPKSFIEDFDWIIKGMDSSAFKRVQAPPVIALANASSVMPFSCTQVRPEPSTRFNMLRSKVLRMER